MTFNPSHSIHSTEPDRPPDTDMATQESVDTFVDGQVNGHVHSRADQLAERQASGQDCEISEAEADGDTVSKAFRRNSKKHSSRDFDENNNLDQPAPLDPEALIDTDKIRHASDASTSDDSSSDRSSTQETGSSGSSVKGAPSSTSSDQNSSSSTVTPQSREEWNCSIPRPPETFTRERGRHSAASDSSSMYSSNSSSEVGSSVRHGHSMTNSETSYSSGHANTEAGFKIPERAHLPKDSQFVGNGNGEGIVSTKHMDGHEKSQGDSVKTEPEGAEDGDEQPRDGNQGANAQQKGGEAWPPHDFPLHTVQVSQTPFIQKLYAMLEDPAMSHVITWGEKEDTFLVNPKQEFSSMLCMYFKHTNISSFVRQLSMYGFQKVSSHKPRNPDFPWEFRHMNGTFLRGDIKSLRTIKRRLSRKANTKRTKYVSLVDSPMSYTNGSAAMSSDSGNRSETSDTKAIHGSRHHQIAPPNVGYGHNQAKAFVFSGQATMWAAPGEANGQTQYPADVQPPNPPNHHQPQPQAYAMPHVGQASGFVNSPAFSGSTSLQFSNGNGTSAKPGLSSSAVTGLASSEMLTQMQSLQRVTQMQISTAYEVLGELARNNAKMTAMLEQITASVQPDSAQPQAAMVLSKMSQAPLPAAIQEQPQFNPSALAQKTGLSNSSLPLGGHTANYPPPQYGSGAMTASQVVNLNNTLPAIINQNSGLSNPAQDYSGTGKLDQPPCDEQQSFKLQSLLN